MRGAEAKALALGDAGKVVRRGGGKGEREAGRGEVKEGEREGWGWRR